MTETLTAAQQKMVAAYEFHTGAEFVTHKTADAMASMVSDPYVALLPALTSGNGPELRAGVELVRRHHLLLRRRERFGHLVPPARSARFSARSFSFCARTTELKQSTGPVPARARHRLQ